MESFAETPEGILLIANGCDPVLRWDGLTDEADTAGVLPPTTAPTLGGSGVGAIVGTYYAYLRFVDELGNYSNLSPLSTVYTATGSTGTITAATNATPIVVTSAAHGLTTGTTVKITGVGGNISANNTWTITVLTPSTFSLDTSTGTADYTGGGAWTSGVSTISYSLVVVPTEPKVVRRQLLRNTDGQTQTFYVDVDTTDLTGASFTSTLSDSFLSAQESQPILDADGNALANIYTVPPNHKTVLAHHLDRMFLAGQEDYVLGNVQTSLGSTSVVGVGTAWTASLAGRLLYVNGAKRSFLISSVDVAAQTLTLSEAYTGATDLFAVYAIRPEPTQARLVYFSEAGKPEAWPATNAFSLQEDSDVITGLMPKDSFIYILERRHVYRFTFQDSPLTDGAVFLSANRGCINNRCWVVTDETAYMLDEQGVHAFGGGRGGESVSEQIKPLFNPTTDCPFKINWAASRYFHAVHLYSSSVIRWFVCFSGCDLPRHALCFNYRRQRWWLEEFAMPIGGSCGGTFRNQPRNFIGVNSRRVFLLEEGTLDGPDATAGVVRGRVTSSSLCTLSDSLATFATSGLVGSPLAIVGGAGKGQSRTITAVSATTLTVKQPWSVLPDTTSVYQLGGVPWRWQSGWFRFAPDETMAERRVEMVYQPTPQAATMDLRMRLDFAETPVNWRSPFSSGQGAGVESTAGNSDLVIDLSKSSGVAQKKFPAHKEFYIDGRRYSQLELRGFSGRDRVKIYELSYDGVLTPTGGE